MTRRTTRKTVTFSRPFILSGMDEEQPAGTYTVETEEELLEGLSLRAYRRIATFMLLHPASGTAASARIASIDPLELEAALKTT